MDPEVIEIPPPVFQTPIRRKRKEVIDLDKDEDSSDVIFLDEIVKTVNKGKALKNDSDGSDSYQPKGFLKSSDLGSHSIINLDIYNEQHVNVVDDFIDVEDYAILQAYFDSADIPTGVEAPVPWLADPSLRNVKAVNGSDSMYAKPPSESSSSLPKTKDVLGLPVEMDISSSWVHPQYAHSKNSAASQRVGSSAQNLQSYAKSSNLPWLRENSKSVYKPFASGISINNNSVNQLNPMMNHYGVGSSLSTFGTFPPVQNQVGASDLFYSSKPAFKNTPSFPPAVGPFIPGWHGSLNAKLNSPSANYLTHPSVYNPLDDVHVPPKELPDSPRGQDCDRNKESVDEEDILRKFNFFKQFDAVEDHSDHHYASKASSTPSNKLMKRIQEEWKILENDLPDTIFVRVYESRMDLMRAVIIGAEGTPYHDGLFFFDVFFPSDYPAVPPHVYYHSGGLRLNPNLYNSGKVCLSLLNTWSGNKNEKWIPSMSTMLQVLVSIQALILNQKPYFNEPGYANWNGTSHGETESRKYNQSTIILSLKTMVYTVRRPPKHFKDFVVGHFYKRAHSILAACKAYMDGVDIGCVLKDCVQNIHKNTNGCIPNFKTSMAANIDILAKEFKRIGVKDSDKFLSQAKAGKVPGVDNNPKAGSTRFRL